MPTGRNSDVVPVRKETKRRLDALRGGSTYDEVVQRLLDECVGPPPRAPAAAPPRDAPAGRARDPDEQLLVARLAATRWRIWEERGRARWLGPRLVEYRPSDAKPEVQYVVGRRRGFSP